MSITNTFATQQGPIPLLQLDQNFADFGNTTDPTKGSALIGVKRIGESATTLSAFLQAMGAISQFTVYNAAISNIRMLKGINSGTSLMINGVVDGFKTQQGIDTGASTNINYDSRGGYEPTRSGSQTSIGFPFNNLTGWTNSSGGTAAVNIVADNTNPPYTNTAEFTTGGTIGSNAILQRTLGTLPPASFGVGVIVELIAVGSNSADALTVEVANTNNKNLQMRFRPLQMEIFQDGAFQTMNTTTGGNFYTEWWAQCTDVGGGNHKVDIYAGTELVASRTGGLPGGSGAGLVVITQHSGVTSNRISRTQVINIGTSQLPDNMTLLSLGTAATQSPATARIIVIDEDIANAIVVNTDLVASISRDGGVTYQPVTLLNPGNYGPGVVDSTKNIKIYTGELIFFGGSGTSMKYRIQSSGGKYHSVEGVYMEWL